MKKLARFSSVIGLALNLLTACATTPATPSYGDLSETQLTQLASANSARDGGDLATASRLYTQLVADSKTSVAAHIGLADLDRRAGHSQDAVRVMLEAQKRQPDNTDVLKHLGYALIDSDHSADAVAVFNRMIAADPQSAHAYNGKGVALDHLGKHAEAQTQYQEALKRSPDSVAFRNNLAMSYILNDQLTQAIDLLEGMMPQTSDNKTLRQNLALAYGLKGEKKKALALNMVDVSSDEARENLKFYEKYARQRHKPLKAKRSKKNFIEPADAGALPSLPEVLMPASVDVEPATAFPAPVEPVRTATIPTLEPSAGKTEPSLKRAPREAIPLIDELDDGPHYPSSSRP